MKLIYFIIGIIIASGWFNSFPDNDLPWAIAGAAWLLIALIYSSLPGKGKPSEVTPVPDNEH